MYADAYVQYEGIDEGNTAGRKKEGEIEKRMSRDQERHFERHPIARRDV